MPYQWFFAPYPPTPFPGGEGGDFRLFYARGFAPCIPGAGWGAALGKGANHAPGGGGGCPVGCLPTLPLLYFLAPYPPTPFPAGRGRPKLFYARGFAPCIPGAGRGAALGKGKIFTLFRRGLPPPAPLRLNLYGAGSTFGKQFLSVMPKTFPFNNIIEKSP